MTEAHSNIFVFVVLPLAFLVFCTYVFVYTRRISARIHKMEGPGGRLDSLEAGIAAAMEQGSVKSTRTR